MASMSDPTQPRTDGQTYRNGAVRTAATRPRTPSAGLSDQLRRRRRGERPGRRRGGRDGLDRPRPPVRRRISIIGDAGAATPATGGPGSTRGGGGRTESKVLIIGSGPAGLTAAIYAARANLEPIVHRRARPPAAS